MPQQHMRCMVCHDIQLVTYRSADVGGPAWPPRCHRDLRPWGLVADCNSPMERAPQPGDFGFDLKTDGEGGQGFQKFTIHRQVPTKDGLRQVEEVIDSVHKLRQVERDSEQRYANGEGEPLRFRAYAQDRSNMGTSSLGTSGTIGGRSYASGETPRVRNPKISTRRHGEQQPRIPVARGAGRSPLPGMPSVRRERS